MDSLPGALTLSQALTPTDVPPATPQLFSPPSYRRHFEFILEIENRMANVLQDLGREDDATEIRRRLQAVAEVIKEG